MPTVARLPLLWLVAVAVSLAACDTGTSGSPPPPPPDDDVVAGVNLDALFAPPSTAELLAVEAEWAQRDATLSSRYVFSFVAETEAGDGATYRVYLGEDAAEGGALFYGLLRLPPRPPGDQRARPLVLTLPDDGPEVRAGSFFEELPILSAVRSDFVYALVAYRGMALDVGGTRYESPAPPSAYDHDTDDALAFLAHVRALGASVLVDSARVGALGLGRGGGVALLTSARSNPYGIIVDLAGPTDLFLGAFRSRVRSFLATGARPPFPAFDTLADDVLVPLRDGALSYAGARRALLRRSPRYFVNPPPYTLVAHGTLDFVVSPDHGRVLSAVLTKATGLYYEREEVDHAALPTDPEIVSIVTDQLIRRLGGP